MAADGSAIPLAGEIVEAVLADEATLVVLGRCPLAVPESGALRIGGNEPLGRYGACSWAGGSVNEALWFTAVLECPDIVRDVGCGFALLDGDGRVRLAVRELPPVRLLVSGLADRIVAEASGGRAVVIELLIAQATASSCVSLHAMLKSLLEAVSAFSGFIEVVGSATGVGLLIQGWSAEMRAGSNRLYLCCDSVVGVDMLTGTFERPDLPTHGRGIMCLAAEAGVPPDHVRVGYHVAGDAVQRLDLFDQPLILSEETTLLHIRDMLPRVTADAASLRRMWRLAGPRYAGVETVSAFRTPVRAALDLAVEVEDAGLLLVGWMLDPETRVHTVELADDYGRRVSVDDRWVRIARRDVTEGFVGDPGFVGRLDAHDDLHGFIVALDTEELHGTMSPYHLRIQLVDGEVGYLPVRKASDPSASLLRRMLSSFDISDPAAATIVADHVGPVAIAALSQRPSAETVRFVERRFGDRRPDPAVTVVLPAPATALDIDINLATLAFDTEIRHAEMLVVGVSGRGSGLGGALHRYGEFYGLNGRLLLARQSLELSEALELGARAAKAPLLLFLSPNVLPSAKRWLKALVDALSSHPRAAAATPTLLYEDHSIKFGGTRARRSGLDGREADGFTGFTGYTRGWLGAKAPAVVEACAIECCLIRRGDFLAVGGFARDYVGTEWLGADLALRLRRAGRKCLWVPGVEMLTFDAAAPPEVEYWQRVGTLVDHWGFERRWRGEAMPVEGT